MIITSVGSFPKPDSVKRVRNLPENHPERISAEKKATRFWIEVQENLNYDVLVHGEMERGDMAAYFGEKIEGMQPGKEPVRSYGNRFWKPPEICGPLRWRPLTIDSYKFAQSLTKKPVKGMLTGPGTIYDWSIDLYYGERKKAILSLAKVLREEILELRSAGAEYIQIDEPSLAHVTDTDTLHEALNIMTKDVPAYFILHTCYGAKSFAKIYPEMLKFPVHNLDLELANGGMEFLETMKKYPVEKDITAGIIDVHDHRVEHVEEVKDRIKKVRSVVPEERVWLSPDCGLKTRSVQEAIGKLTAISQARDSLSIKI